MALMEEQRFVKDVAKREAVLATQKKEENEWDGGRATDLSLLCTFSL